MRTLRNFWGFQKGLPQSLPQKSQLIVAQQKARGYGVSPKREQEVGTWWQSWGQTKKGLSAGSTKRT